MYISTHLYIYGTQWDEARRQICNRRQAIACDSVPSGKRSVSSVLHDGPHQCYAVIVTGRERNNGTETTGTQERAHHNELLRGNRPDIGK